MIEQKGVKTAQNPTTSSQQQAVLLRYYYDVEQKMIFINMVPSLYHKWSQKAIKHHKKHCEQLILEEKTMNLKSGLEAPIMIIRNREKSQLTSLNPNSIVIQNRITHKVDDI